MSEEFIRERDGELERLEIQLSGLKLLKEQLDGRIEEERSKLQQFTGDTLQLKFAQDDLARAEEIHSLIASRKIRLDTERVAPDQVTLWDEAVAPLRPVEELPYKKLALAGLFGFCIPFVWLWRGSFSTSAWPTPSN
jgi:hypothetical protein